MSRLKILKSSLKKKEDKFNKKINDHFGDVASANGQPLNDKRNGPATMRRWDRQNNAISNLQKEIDKTKSAIEREEGKLIGMARNKELMPKEITDLIDNGILIQWGKYPHPVLFVIKMMKIADIALIFFMIHACGKCIFINPYTN